jgi:hypothetical protein
MAFSELQIIQLRIVMRTFSVLSILGSAFIIYEVLNNPKKRRMAYHRQMLILSCSDLIFSASNFFVASWPAPDSGWCTAKGFIALSTAVPEAMYNAGLCVYYMLTIRYQWTEQQVLRLQPLLIIFPILWGLASAIAPLVRGMIHHNPVYGCWIIPSPSGCLGSQCIPDESYYHLYNFIFIYIPRWISFGVALIAMGLVYVTVSKEERDYGGEAPLGILWFAQREEGQDDSRQTRSRRMARQAFWYLLNFFMTYVGITALRIVDALGGNGSGSFGLLCFTMIFLPW